MIMSDQRTHQFHLGAVHHVQNARDIPGRVDNHAFARFVVADQVDEICHLSGKVVLGCKVTPSQQLFDKQSHKIPLKSSSICNPTHLEKPTTCGVKRCL